MHLIYIDESGQTGTNLRDTAQSVFVLGALVVPESVWLGLEKDLQAVIERSFAPARPEDFEIHATEISNPRHSYFRQFPIAHRLAFRDEWFRVAQKHALKFVYRAISKKRFQTWSHNTFGSGVAINPHVAACPRVARVVDDLLKSLPGSPLGIFLSDENREVVGDVEKAIRVLRGTEGVLKLGQIVEKGFFIEPEKSPVLQLCDLCVYAARRREEKKTGFTVKSIDESGIPLIEPLLHVGDERLGDVITWLEQQQRKGRPGN
ncbi:MAG: DUF3800 domain-containing protein [Verrucomicrobiota bacterium]